MSLFDGVVGRVVGSAVSSIFGSDSGSSSGGGGTSTTVYAQSKEPTSLLSKSVMSGRQAQKTFQPYTTGTAGGLAGAGPRGLKAVQPRYISSETEFWGALFNRAINESQATVPKSNREQSQQFRR